MGGGLLFRGGGGDKTMLSGGPAVKARELKLVSWEGRNSRENGNYLGLRVAG